MDFRSFVLGSGDFKTPSEIVDVVRKSPDFDPTEQGSEEPLLIFHTSKQQTWLIATNQRLFCILDDLNRGTSRIQWSMSKKVLVQGSSVVVPISTRDKTEATGLLDIGKHRGWLFTKKLFAREPADASVRKLIADNMDA